MQLFEICIFFGEIVDQWSYGNDVHNPGLLNLTQGHQKKWIQKSYVSFEEECM